MDEASIIISAADDHALSDFEGIDCGVSARQRSAKLAGRYQVRRADCTLAAPSQSAAAEIKKAMWPAAI